ncbi:MAG: hypothetical protein RL722_1946 [Pseudomonadota bacterium]|jgi:AraC-like DNA-binding protein
MPTAARTVAAAITPMAFVRTIAAAYAARGLALDGLLAAAQITPDELAQPAACITAAQLEAASGHAMKELDDEGLGWFSRRLPWGSYGLLCRASLSAPDLGLALARWCRHHRLLTEDLGFVLERPEVAAAGAEPLARLRLVEQRDFGAGREFCLLTYLRFVHGWASWSIDSLLPLQQVTLPFERPSHGALYEKLFPGPVVFGAAEASLVFAASYLALPQRRDEAALQRLLARLLPLTVKPYKRDRLLVQRVRALLAQATVVPGAGEGGRSGAEAGAAVALDAAAMARALHLSPRSLFRRLAEEGASLQQLKEEARLEQARHWLTRSERPIKQIAGLAGYASEKSFARAFKLWTGLTPSDYRRREPGRVQSQ